MINCEAFLVALANFGEDINPVLGLNTVICLNVQDSFRLNHLEHLKKGSKPQTELSACFN